MGSSVNKNGIVNNPCTDCPLKSNRLRNNYKHEPADYIEGDKNAAIWIVGLNPKLNKDKKGNLKSDNLKLRSKEDFKNPLKPETHTYFKPFFTRVSDKLWERQKGSKVANFAHTDLVCCASNKFPIERFDTKKNDKIVDQCSQYLIEKVKDNKDLKLLIGAGKRTCIELVKAFANDHDKKLIYKEGKFISNNKIYDIIKKKTKTTLLINKDEIPIIFTTHLSQSNYWSDQRLGREIEEVLDN